LTARELSDAGQGREETDGRELHDKKLHRQEKDLQRPDHVARGHLHGVIALRDIIDKTRPGRRKAVVDRDIGPAGPGDIKVLSGSEENRQDMAL